MDKIERECRVCKKSFTLYFFHKDKCKQGGYRYDCKKCRKHISKIYYSENRLAISSKQFALRRINSAEINRVNRVWKSKNKERVKASMVKYRNANRLKENSRRYFMKRLLKGIILRQPCKICGNKAEAHHSDYRKPLEVLWLCRKHHGAWHRTFLTEDA